MKLFLTAVCTVGLLAAGFGKTAPAVPKTEIKITTPASDMPVGSKAVFYVTVTGANAASKIKVVTDGNPAIRKKYDTVTDADGKLQITLPITRPGVIFCRVYCGDKQSSAAVMTAPEKVVPGLPEPEDFKAYWDKIKAELDARPMDAELTPLKTENNVLGFKVKLPMGGEGKDAYAKFTLPAGAKPKSLPARLVLFGAGTDFVRPSYGIAGSRKMMVMNLNPMPVDNEEYLGKFCKGSYKGYKHWGAGDRDKIFFNGMFKRLYRALQFLKSRPEWDGKILIASGGSQGGGQALAAAGLDPAVSCVVAYVPALCNHGNRSKGDCGWPAYYGIPAKRISKKAVLYATSYIDVVNFARYIKPETECFVSTGLIDRVCPPESVFAAYNVIRSKNKVLSITPTAGHNVPKHVGQQAEKFIHTHIKKMQNKK